MHGLRRCPHCCIVACLTLLGCAAASPGPRGPLLGRGAEIAADLSFAYGQGKATLPDGATNSGSADNFWSQTTILPRRLEGRLSPVPWADVGGQIGWLGGGIDARVGLPALEETALAFNLAGGLESGEVGPFKDTKPSGSKWLRLELYPRLPSRKTSARLVVAAGVAKGHFYHELPDPRPQTNLGDGIAPPPSLQLLRDETRLETTLGLFLRTGRAGSLLFTLSPYFVLDAGTPDSSCSGCDQLASYKQQWGIVLVSRFAFHAGLQLSPGGLCEHPALRMWRGGLDVYGRQVLGAHSLMLGTLLEEVAVPDLTAGAPTNGRNGSPVGIGERLMLSKMRRIAGVYLQYRWDIVKNLTLTAGGRLDNFPRACGAWLRDLRFRQVRLVLTGVRPCAVRVGHWLKVAVE